MAKSTAKAGSLFSHASQASCRTFDAPILRYLTGKEFSASVQVLENTFSHQDYAFALPEKSPYLETLNPGMLEVISTDAIPGVPREPAPQSLGGGGRDSPFTFRTLHFPLTSVESCLPSGST